MQQDENGNNLLHIPWIFTFPESSREGSSYDTSICGGAANDTKITNDNWQYMRRHIRTLKVHLCYNLILIVSTFTIIESVEF